MSVNKFRPKTDFKISVMSSKGCKLPCDFMRLQEPSLNMMVKNFAGKSDLFSGKLENLQESVDRCFSSDGLNKPCNACCTSSACDTLQNSYADLVKELIHLKKHQSALKTELQNMKEAEIFREPDIELLGLNYNQQTSIIAERLIIMNREKKLLRKIFASLLKEMEFFQNKELDPTIEAEVLSKMLQAPKAQYERIEDQFNKEVRRIEDMFMVKWVELAKSKRKFDRIDWMLRTEMQPKKVHLTNLLFDTKEHLKRNGEEIAVVNQENFEQSDRDQKLESKFPDLRKELEDLTADFKEAEFNVKELRKGIRQISGEIETTRTRFNLDITEIQENVLIAHQMKEVYRYDLDLNADESCKSTLKKNAAADCVIKELTNKIGFMAMNMQDSKLRCLKLQDDIDFLMSRDTREVPGIDHQGNVFIKINEVQAA